MKRAWHGPSTPVRCPWSAPWATETDFTIADFVADLRAPTPSAAAELLSPDQNELLQTLEGFAQLLRRLIGERLQRDTRQLLWLTRQLKHPGRRLQEHAQALDMLEGRLLRATRHHLAHTANALERLRQRLSLHSPAAAIARQQLRQEALRHRLQRAMQQMLAGQQAALAQLARSLDSVSPLHTLRRGYSITFDTQQQVVRDTATLAVGQTLKTQLGSGAILSTVTALLPDSHITET